MYNLYINEKRTKEKEDKIKKEEQDKILQQKRQSKQRHYYIIFISK